jgi:hypothetical protein
MATEKTERVSTRQAYELRRSAGGLRRGRAEIIANSRDLEAPEKLIVEAGENPEEVALERIELEDAPLGSAERGSCDRNLNPIPQAARRGIAGVDVERRRC